MLQFSNSPLHHFRKLAVHPMSAAGQTAMPRASTQARQLHGTRKNRFTVATFRSWRGSPPSVAWNPAVNASTRGSSRRHDVLDREFDPAIAGCRSGRLAPVVGALAPSLRAIAFRVASP